MECTSQNTKFCCVPGEECFAVLVYKDDTPFEIARVRYDKTKYVNCSDAELLLGEEGQMASFITKCFQDYWESFLNDKNPPIRKRNYKIPKGYILRKITREDFICRRLIMHESPSSFLSNYDYDVLEYVGTTQKK